jgi:chemotaxis protein methyltransferase CheR
LFAEGVVYRRAAADATRSARVAPAAPAPPTATASHVHSPPPATRPPPASHSPQMPPPAAPDADGVLARAREFADRGDYARAEAACREALAAAPLAAAPHFLLAQLAQLRGDFAQAGQLLDKTLYLDPLNVPAYLEQAALCERAENLPRAQTLRRAALDIVRALPGNAVVEPYEATAGQMAQWLTQWAGPPPPL